MKWNPRNRKILMLARKSTPTREIATIVGISQRQVERIVNEPEFDNKLREINTTVLQASLADNVEEEREEMTAVMKARRNIEKESYFASRLLSKVARGKVKASAQQIAAANSILDRANIKGKETMEIQDTRVSKQEASEAKEVLSEMVKQLANLSNTTNPYLMDKRPEAHESKSQDRPTPMQS